MKRRRLEGWTFFGTPSIAGALLGLGFSVALIVLVDSLVVDVLAAAAAALDLMMLGAALRNRQAR